MPPVVDGFRLLWFPLGNRTATLQEYPQTDGLDAGHCTPGATATAHARHPRSMGMLFHRVDRGHDPDMEFSKCIHSLQNLGTAESH